MSEQTKRELLRGALEYVQVELETRQSNGHLQGNDSHLLAVVNEALKMPPKRVRFRLATLPCTLKDLYASIKCVSDQRLRDTQIRAMHDRVYADDYLEIEGSWGR